MDVIEQGGAGPRDCMVVYQSSEGVGAVQAFDSTEHLGICTEQEAAHLARALAVSHPGVVYSVVRLVGSVTHSAADHAALRQASKGARCMGDVYAAAGLRGSARAHRFLPEV